MMVSIKGFFRRMMKDFRQKKLIPLKLIFFVQTSTSCILYPYLTIHMRELGISVEETAIMMAFISFIAIIMPPLAGLVADWIGNFKVLLSLLTGLGGAAALLLLLVPVGRANIEYPKSLVLATAGCGSDANFIYEVHQNYPCDTILGAETELTLQSCGYSCTLGALNDSYIKDILASRSYKLNVHNVKLRSNTNHQYKIFESEMPEKPELALDIKETRKLENTEYYEIAVRQLSSDTLFFPAQRPPLFGFVCDAISNSTMCAFKFGMTEPIRMQKLKTSLREIKPTDIDKAEQRHRFLAEGIQCALGSDEEIETAGVEVQLADKVIKLDECSRSCVFTAPRKEVCSNMKVVIEYDPTLTFFTYLAGRVLIGIIGATAFPMFEGAVIAILREEKADYGFQKVYGSIGGMISSPLSGMLIDYASRDKGYSDLRPAFYLYAALKIVTSFLTLLINLEFKAPSSNVTSEVMKVLKNIEVVALLIACFVLAMVWGYIESFLFWLLEDMGASKSLMGITITVGGVAGIPLLALSGPIINKIGHANVIFIGFLFYSIRTLGYSLIQDPRLCLIFEALESITSHLTTIAVVTYAAKLSTTSTDSSIQGLLGGLYHGVGKGIGSLTGGFLMKAVGTRSTFQIFSGLSLLTGLMYQCFNVLHLLKRPKVEDIDLVEKKPNGDSSIAKSIEVSKYKNEKEIEKEAHIIEDMEVINNAKNLDIVEIIEDVEKSQRHGGLVNDAFQAHEEMRK